ncbi:hypothetical protein CODIS_07310 [Candidatus Thiodiazotropha endolucinida]|uniref:Uncharacterized protein n=1 Tax=Candidatus Thiodiazotropha endolucinida TaxID=1655433 RepID=A0A7Z0VNS9_9GAMM|nr:hypothetical protein CODIS_07310 [Candidatus Thiodiazotropha endolucinida]
MRSSGLCKSELLGRQHNIIRHPDMPRGVVNELWETIAIGVVCFANHVNVSSH